jgi:hypothetical protein
MQLKLLRTLTDLFVGWPGLTVVVVIVISVGIYLDSGNFTSVRGRTAIQNLLTGHTLKFEGYAFFYRSDGKVVGEVAQNYDVGVWEAFENVYCEQWQIWGDGIRRCFAIETDGDRLRRTGTGFPFDENDAPINEFQRLEGNQIYSH